MVQPAPADREPVHPGRRSGLDPSDRIGRPRSRASGDADEHAEAGRRTRALPPEAPAADPAGREEAPSGRGSRRVDPPGAPDARSAAEGRMPTDAKRATVAELRGDLSRSTTLVTTAVSYTHLTLPTIYSV